MLRVTAVVSSLLALAIFALSTGAAGATDKDPRTYKYDAEQFEVANPSDGVLTITDGSATGTITVHPRAPNGPYRDELDGWWFHHGELQAAVDNLCRRLLERRAQTPAEQLRKKIEEFYGGLPE